MSIRERIERYAVPEPNTGCVLWTAMTTHDGYARLKYQGRHVYVHRAAYELAFGAIPGGLSIDHLCRVRCCVNPDHMEAVTQRENTLRGDGVSAKHAKKTHCPHGHMYTETNTYRHQGRRHCLACRAARGVQ